MTKGNENENEVKIVYHLSEIVDDIISEGHASQEDITYIKENLIKFLRYYRNKGIPYDNNNIRINLDKLVIAVGEKEFAESIFKIEHMYAQIGTDITPLIIFKALGDKDYLKQVVSNPELRLQSRQRRLILEEIGDNELIDKFIRDGSYPLDTVDRGELIEKLYGDNVEELEKIFLNNFCNYIESDILKKWLIRIGNNELIDRIVRNPSYRLNPKDRGELIEKLYGDNLKELENFILNKQIKNYIDTDSKVNWLIKIGNKRLMRRVLYLDHLVFTEDAINCAKLLYAIYDGNEEKIEKYLFNKVVELDSGTKRELLILINNQELIERCIKDPKLKLSPKDKEILILKTYNGDINRLLNYLTDSLVGLSKLHKERLIGLIKDKNIIKKLIRDKKIDITWKARIEIASDIEDLDFINEELNKAQDIDSKAYIVSYVENEEFVYKFLKDHTDDFQNFNILSLVEKIQNPEKLKEFEDLVRKEDKTGQILDYITKRLKTKELRDEWKNKSKTITNVNELSTEELEKNPQIKYVKLVSLESNIVDYYTREEFIEIKRKIDELLKGIPIPKEGDFTNELKAFEMIARRLSHITFNNYATTEEGRKDEKLQKTCRNLYDGLVEGTCVCQRICRYIGTLFKSNRNRS